MAYRVHARIYFGTKINGKWAQSGSTITTDTEGAERLFERICSGVEKYEQVHVIRVEVKQGHEVLFSQAFENGVRL